jgi:hypothetical protein
MTIRIFAAGHEPVIEATGLVERLVALTHQLRRRNLHTNRLFLPPPPSSENCLIKTNHGELRRPRLAVRGDSLPGPAAYLKTRGSRQPPAGPQSAAGMGCPQLQLTVWHATNPQRTIPHTPTNPQGPNTRPAAAPRRGRPSGRTLAALAALIFSAALLLAPRPAAALVYPEAVEFQTTPPLLNPPWFAASQGSTWVTLNGISDDKVRWRAAAGARERGRDYACTRRCAGCVSAGSAAAGTRARAHCVSLPSAAPSLSP